MVSDFITVYAKISKMSVENVTRLLEIQNEQFTEYSRVKTCKELWDHQQKKIIDAFRLIENWYDTIEELCTSLGDTSHNDYLKDFQELKKGEY